jgi:hypothetical protein
MLLNGYFGGYSVDAGDSGSVQPKSVAGLRGACSLLYGTNVVDIFLFQL